MLLDAGYKTGSHRIQPDVPRDRLNRNRGSQDSVVELLLPKYLLTASGESPRGLSFEGFQHALYIIYSYTFSITDAMPELRPPQKAAATKSDTIGA